MTTSIPESIVLHEKMFRYQLRVLFLKTLFSKSLGDQEAYRANLIALLDHASTKLMSAAEVVKTYPQEDAMKYLEAANNLKLLIGRLNKKLQESNFVESEQVRISIQRAINGTFRFAAGIQTSAGSNHETVTFPSIPLSNPS